MLTAIDSQHPPERLSSHYNKGFFAVDALDGSESLLAGSTPLSADEMSSITQELNLEREHFHLITSFHTVKNLELTSFFTAVELFCFNIKLKHLPKTTGSASCHTPLRG